ncbi:WW domain-binding protein 11-like [Cavia porcellus]|uniref:WW domain-binding protein 11-like n=1 Tax=Cavia porcellus TaxID=10141 RepID=UPI002FE3888A
MPLRVEATLHGPEPSLSLCDGARRDTTPASPSLLHGPVSLWSPQSTGTLACDFQLEQEAEDQKNLHAELSEEIRSLEKSQRHLEAALAHKDDRISALTKCIIQLNQFESGSPGPGRCEPGELANAEVGVPCMGPPLGFREYAPGMLPGRRDLLLHPCEFLPGPVPFRPPGPLGPREYFIPAPRRPPPPTRPQDYPLPPAAGGPLLSEPKEAPASPQSSREPAHTLRQNA